MFGCHHDDHQISAYTKFTSTVGQKILQDLVFKNNLSNLHSTVLDCSVVHLTSRNYIVLAFIELHCSVLHYTVTKCTTLLQWTFLHCTVLHHIGLQ